MSNLCKNKSEESICSEFITECRRMKWEYPKINSEKYWEKIFEEEKKKILVVRDPSLNLSYHSYSKDLNLNRRPSELNSFPNFSSDSFKISKNSLHKLSSLECTHSGNKGYSNTSKLFPESILKPSSRAPSKSSATPCNLDTPSKVTRIPKLDTPSPQPSFGRVFPGRVDHIRASFGVENKPKTLDESFPVSSSTLPTLNTLPAVSVSRASLKKSRKNLSKHPTTKYPKILGGKNVRERKSIPSSNVPPLNDERRDHASLEDENSLKYSIRCAYKALKRLTKDKNLDFNLETTKPSSETSFSKSSYDFLAKREEKLRLLELEKSKRLEEKRRLFKCSKLVETEVGSATSKSEKAISKTIPSGSRSTSGLSPEFVYPDSWVGPSSRILSSVPKLSGFPRKNCDRCLACMYKSLDAPSQPKTSSPMTALRKILSSASRSVTPSSSSSEGSIPASIAELQDELERIVNCDTETVNVTFDEEHEAPEDRVVKEVPFCSEERREETVGEQATEERSVSDSESSHKPITKRNEEDQRDGGLTFVVKNLNDVADSAKVGSLEQLGVSSSVQSDGSVEDDSLVVSMSENQSNPMYTAPCHVPVNFRPSLEPLRALRNRKSTALQNRNAKCSSMRKSTSTDDYDDVPEKPRAKDVSNKSKTDDAGRATSVGRTLMKAKSVAEGMVLRNARDEDVGKGEGVLRRGSSLFNLTSSVDILPEESEVCQEASGDASRDPKSSGDSSRISPARFPRLPITTMQEIMEILENVNKDASSTHMLDILCKEFSERLSRNTEDVNAKRSNKMIATLTRLLVDSKPYLHPEKFPSDLLFSTNQPPPCNPRILRRILPKETYEAIEQLLGLPDWHWQGGKVIKDGRRYNIDQPKPSDTTVLSEDNDLASLEVHLTTFGDTKLASDKKKVGQRKNSPYALFLMKPRRKVITWRPLTKDDLEGYDPDATLLMRVENMMTKICRNFCQWVETLGGTDKTIDEEVLRDMFEIDFHAEVCKTMKVLIEEMRVVPTEVALTRNTPAASKLTMTKWYVTRDVRAEESPQKTQAFGTSIPRDIRFIPPKNQVRKNWLECEHVPPALETMDMVWNGITNIKSVIGFVEWLQQNPQVPPPEALKTIVSIDIRTLRQFEDDETFAHLELDLAQITSLRIPVTNE